MKNSLFAIEFAIGPVIKLEEEEVNLVDIHPNNVSEVNLSKSEADWDNSKQEEDPMQTPAWVRPIVSLGKRLKMKYL